MPRAKTARDNFCVQLREVILLFGFCPLATIRRKVVGAVQDGSLLETFFTEAPVYKPRSRHARSIFAVSYRRKSPGS
mgnify:FL=1